MKRQLERIIVVSACALLSGCAHYYLPATQLETPEARGGLGAGRFELIGIQTGSDLSATPVQPAADPETGEVPSRELPLSAPRYSFGFSMGLSERVDVGVRLEPYSPLLLRAKYQFLGVAEREALQGNFSASVTGAAGVMFVSGSPAEARYLAAKLGVPGGYRFAANHLVSLTPFFSMASISGAALPAAGGADSLSATQFGLALGYQYTILGLITRAEIVRSWGAASEISIGRLFGGLMLGFAF